MRKWFLVAAQFLVGMLLGYCIFAVLGAALFYGFALIEQATSPDLNTSYLVPKKELLIPIAILIYPLYALFRKLGKEVVKVFR